MEYFEASCGPELEWREVAYHVCHFCHPDLCMGPCWKLREWNTREKQKAFLGSIEASELEGTN